MGGITTELRTGLAFCTRLPVTAPEDGNLAQAAWSFPVVGALIGALGAAVYWLADGLSLPPFVSATPPGASSTSGAPMYHTSPWSNSTAEYLCADANGNRSLTVHPGGAGYAEGQGMGGQVLAQIAGVLAIAAWAGALTWILLKLADAVAGMRVAGDEETEGLDTVLHNEKGYNL